MRIKYKQLEEALYKLRSEAGLGSMPNPIIDVEVREEDIQSGVIGDAIVVKVSTTKDPSQYDSFKGQITSEYTLEVFSEGDNRPPRLTTITTRDLNPQS